MTTLNVELAGQIYFWFSLVSLEIFTSFFFTIGQNGNIRTRFSNRFRSTQFYISWAIILAFIYYLGDRFLSESIIKYLSNLDGVILLPLSVLSISFFAFYTTKVMLGRRWRFRLTIVFLGISLVSLALVILMALS